MGSPNRFHGTASFEDLLAHLLRQGVSIPRHKSGRRSRTGASTVGVPLPLIWELEICGPQPRYTPEDLYDRLLLISSIMSFGAPTVIREGPLILLILLLSPSPPFPSLLSLLHGSWHELWR